MPKHTIPKDENFLFKKVKYVNFHLENNHGQCLALPKRKHFLFYHTFESNFLLATTRATCLPNCLVLYNSSSYHPYLSVQAKNLN